jgi:hypothetical protein
MISVRNENQVSGQVYYMVTIIIYNEDTHDIDDKILEKDKGKTPAFSH